MKGHRVWIPVMEEKFQIWKLEIYIQVQELAHHRSCVTLPSSWIGLNFSFPPWSMGVVQVEDGCGEMAPHTLPVGVETATLVWRVICTLDMYIPLEPAIHL